MFSKIVLVLATVATAVSAVAVPSALDVISPHITAPVAGDVWPVGSIQTITWDTSVVPPQGAIGEILLGHFEDGSSSENLDLANPLATNIQLLTGAINVTVPNVVPRDSYIVALIGGSGNISPEFTISA